MFSINNAREQFMFCNGNFGHYFSNLKKNR